MSDRLNVKDQVMHPLGRWVCEECGNPIHRNVAITVDGRSHHFGCLKKGTAKPAWHCIQCGAELTRSEVVKAYVGGIMQRNCCFCQGYVEPLSRYESQGDTIHSGGI